MKYYAFNESDLDSIGILSSDLNALIALGGALFSVAAGALCECLLTNDANRLGIYHLVLALAALAIGACALAGVKRAKKRKSIIDRIKSESRDISD
jgi:hypothetical protein